MAACGLVTSGQSLHRLERAHRRTGSLRQDMLLACNDAGPGVARRASRRPVAFASEGSQRQGRDEPAVACAWRLGAVWRWSHAGRLAIDGTACAGVGLRLDGALPISAACWR